MSGTWPAHWATTCLGELLAEPLRNGHSARASRAGGVRTLTLTAVTQGDFSERNTKLTAADPVKVESLWLRSGDILIERSNTPELVGTARLYSGPERYAIFPDLLIRARVAPEVLPRFIEALLHTPRVRSYFQRAAQGIAGSMPKISQPTIERLTVGIAPAAEQTRIVEALDSLSSRLDNGIATLERVERTLRRYRASVLKAAVEGRLVPTEAELARAEGRDYDPASTLLNRILAERQSRWEEAELARLAAKGTTPEDDRWRQRYRAAAAADDSGLPELPRGWCWTRLDAFLDRIEAGKNFKCTERPPEGDEIGVVKVSAVTWGRFEEAESKTCTRPDLINPELFVRPGDLLISRANTIQLVGACVIVDRVRRNLMLSDKILRLKVPPGWAPWLLWVLRSGWGRSEIERLATGNQESMRNISQASIRSIRIPLPPSAEARRILTSLESQHESMERMRSTAHANLTRCYSLRQAILRWAFEGMLVEQDPNDESALALLERIRANGAAPQLDPNAQRAAGRREAAATQR